MRNRSPYDSTEREPTPSTFGERLRAIRVAWGWTQDELSQALNIDQTTISAWEREKIKPRGMALAAVAQLLKTPPEVLLSEGPVEFQHPLPPPKTTLNLEHHGWVQLPIDGSAPMEVMDLETGTNEPIFDTQEAILKLISAGRQGRKVWIVMK